MKTTQLILSMLCLLLAGRLSAQPALVLNHNLSLGEDIQTQGQLGKSSAVNANYAVVGSPNDDTQLTNEGLVRIYSTSTGQLLHTLYNPTPNGGAAFGTSLAIEGSRLIVGVPTQSVGGFNGGCVFVYDLAGATPTVPVHKIDNPTSANGDQFGITVALAGNRLAVSSQGDDANAPDAGTVYVFDLGGATPTVPQVTINNPQPAADDRFGTAVALTGNLLAVGAIWDDNGGTDTGSVFAFDLGSATPTMPVLTVNGTVTGYIAYFGWSVAVTGTRILVGAPYDKAGQNDFMGRVYVYDTTSGTPTVPVVMNNPTTPLNRYFGWSLAAHGTQVAVGAVGNSNEAGVAHLFDLGSATPTTVVRTLQNPTPAGGDQFGASVALNSDRLLVGAPLDDLGALNAGTGHLFNLASATPGTPVFSFNQPGPAAGNIAGETVAISGSLVAVGAPLDDVAYDNDGSVLIYDMAGTTPHLPVHRISWANNSASERFARSLALEGSILVVGASNAYVGTTAAAGKVYVFNLASPTPSVPVHTLTAPSPLANNQFGYAVAISGNHVVVGEPNADASGITDAGQVHVFDLGSATPTTPVQSLPNPVIAADSIVFGRAVGISSTRVIVGASAATTQGVTNSGAAHVFDLSAMTPAIPTYTLDYPSPSFNSQFGAAVAISGTKAVVSASRTTGGTLFVYNVAGLGASSTPYLTINNPEQSGGDQFGNAVAFSGSRIVAGSYVHNTGANDTGAAYVFNLNAVKPALPEVTLVVPTIAANDNLGRSVGISGDLIVVGAPGSDQVANDQGAAFVFGPPLSNADLASITLDSGSLSPAFNPATTTYSINLAGGTSSINVTPTCAHAFATLKVNGNEAATGSPINIPLSFGANTITIDVTAQDEVTAKTYTLNANVAGSGTLAFASPVFTVTSGSQAAVADITVLRTVSTEGTISCTLSSADGSATAPAHYTAQNSTAVSLTNGVATSHILIPVAANAATTTARAFTLTLADINSGATFGSPSTATVVILPPASATDAKKPAVTITAPANNATIVDTVPVILSGTATDNIGVAKVQVSVNNGLTYTDATLASIGGTSTTWTINVTPLNGPNAVKVRALDFKGNVSAPATRSFTHLRTLTVGLTGPLNSGAVDAGFVPTSARQVGKSYTITAKPKAGHVFDGWTVNNMTGTGITAASAELPKLTFIMQPGLTLAAKFIVNPFTSPLTGDFSGLILASGAQPAGGTVMSHATTGLCTAKITTTGVMSGSVKVDGLSLPFTAQCDNTGVARFGLSRATTLTLARPGKQSLALALQADLTGATKAITGTLTEMYRGDKVAESTITAHRHAYDGKTASVPAAYVKIYTGRLKARASQGAGFTEHDYPAGDGFVTFKVQANGLVTMAGRLADDTAVTFSGSLSQANHWPIYQSLYSNKGCIAADAALDDTQTDSDATALNMLWFRPYQESQWYPYGWNEGIYIDMLASKYTPPPAALFTGLGAVNPTTGNTNLVFTQGLLANAITKFVNISPDNKTSNAPVSDKSFSLKLATATGLISGDFTHTDGKKPKWQGVLMQKGTNKGGHGYFMSFKPTVLNYLGESGKVSWQAK